MTRLPPHIYHFPGNTAGPCVVVMGGVHGDEKVGVQIVEKLKGLLSMEKISGEIYLIIGNPRAAQKRVRFIDCDLNRLFGDNFHNSNYEEKRASQIAQFLAKADFLLDIHSTTKKSVPFVYCGNTEKHFALARIFGTKYIVSPSSTFKKTGLGACTDNFVDKNGGIGITYECGWNDDSSMFDEAFFKTKQFLKVLGVAFFETPSTEISQEPIYLQVYAKIIAESEDFAFANEYNNFDFVKKGQKIAVDGKKTIFAEKDSYIIFPKKDTSPKSVVCFLGWSCLYDPYPI
ncbi:MAG: succinylglutamate desuccinylase/aspartoacylase family protein [Patescibacteria group bacterium]